MIPDRGKELMMKGGRITRPPSTVRRHPPPRPRAWAMRGPEGPAPLAPTPDTWSRTEGRRGDQDRTQLVIPRTGLRHHKEWAGGSPVSRPLSPDRDQDWRSYYDNSAFSSSRNHSIFFRSQIILKSLRTLLASFLFM